MQTYQEKLLKTCCAAGDKKRLWKRWHNDLNEPKKVTIIPKITHAFEQPGRQVAIKETIDWINKYLKQ